MDLNKVMLIGRVGGDPEIKYSQGGKAFARFSLATGAKWKNEAGEKQERTDWHNVTVFGAMADSVVKNFVTKGKQLYVEGELRHDKVEGADGTTKYFTKVVVGGFGSKLILLGGGSGDGAGSRKASSDNKDDDWDTGGDIPF